jgi:hypothetical protein
MKFIYYPASKRGHANHGWLDSWHSFSFASFYNPELMHFGKLRVLNDDTIAGGTGFGAHPHDNMEIVSIPLEGKLAHQDSTGGKKTLEPGEVQRMTAGTGIVHSEFNALDDEPGKFLQIWIMPDKRNVTPKYDQKKFDFKDNQLTLVVSQDGRDGSLDLNQNANVWLGKFSEETQLDIPLPKDQGLYVFVIEGSAKTQDKELQKRDAEGIYDTDKVTITANANSYLLLMEVPMH